MYLNKPHIGTDNLINIVKNMREYIISKGGQFLFNEKVTDFEFTNNKITGGDLFSINEVPVRILTKPELLKYLGRTNSSDDHTISVVEDSTGLFRLDQLSNIESLSNYIMYNKGTSGARYDDNDNLGYMYILSDPSLNEVTAGGQIHYMWQGKPLIRPVIELGSDVYFTKDSDGVIQYNNGRIEASYGETVEIPNPEFSGLTFNGWTMSNGNTETALYGSSIDNVITSWSDGNVKVTDTFFKNLRTTSGLVTLTPSFTSSCERFAIDSWSDIKDNLERYPDYYPIGCEKEVEIDMDDDGTKESYTVRLSNSSNKEVCSTSGYSQTACGVVIEFVDILTMKTMNSTYTNDGGWASTEMVSWLNNDFYNKLPEDLKSVMILTYPIVSGSGSNVSSPNINYEDAPNNRLYLLSTREIGLNESYDNKNNVNTDTRTLDYYELYNNSNYKDKYNINNVSVPWWLRSATSDNPATFYYSGSSSSYTGAAIELGVAPAFRIGTSKTYRVKFDTDGGSSITTQKVQEATTVTKPENPTKEGYIFDNWFTTSEFTEEYNYNKVILNDTTIYAKFLPKYTLNLDSLNGVIPDTEGWSILNNGTTAIKEIVKEREYGLLPTPTRTGYTFDGWNTSNDGTGNTITNESIVNIDNNQTLFAKWIPIQYVLKTAVSKGSEISITRGDFIEYGVSYTDYAQSKTNVQHDFTTKNGWRILDYTYNAETGLYDNVKLISTGTPVVLGIKALDGGIDSNWKETNNSKIDDFINILKNTIPEDGTYPYNRIDNNMKIAAALYESDKYSEILFKSSGLTSDQSIGAFTRITNGNVMYDNNNTSTVSANDLFSVNGSSVRTLTLPELNKYLGRSTNSELTAITAEEDPIGLFRLDQITNIPTLSSYTMYNIDTTNASIGGSQYGYIYVLASTAKNGTIRDELVEVTATNGRVSSFSGRPLLRPVIELGNNVKLTKDSDGIIQYDDGRRTVSYDEIVEIENPTKEGYTFDGWTIIDGDTSTAMYGNSNNNVTNSWNDSSTKVKDSFFKNLRSTSGLVTLEANWIEGNNQGSGVSSSILSAFNKSSESKNMLIIPAVLTIIIASGLIIYFVKKRKKETIEK